MKTEKQATENRRPVMEFVIDCRPAIALETRRSLQLWRSQGWLDQDSIALVERVLDRSRRGSLSVFVYQLALELRAGTVPALRAASAAELLYAAIDFTDDVEDGDASRNLPEVSLPVCINTAAHLFVLAWRAISELDGGLSVSIASLVSGMFAGQRLELTRQDWGIAAYERMARATGGMQVEAYVRLAAHAAAVPPEPLVRPAGAIGILMHLAADARSHDARLFDLPEAGRSSLADRAARALEEGLAGLPEAVAFRLRGLAGGSAT